MNIFSFFLLNLARRVVLRSLFTTFVLTYSVANLPVIAGDRILFFSFTMSAFPTDLDVGTVCTSRHVHDVRTPHFHHGIRSGVRGQSAADPGSGGNRGRNSIFKPRPKSQQSHTVTTKRGSRPLG